jgi:hypothetical protein
MNQWGSYDLVRAFTEDGPVGAETRLKCKTKKCVKVVGNKRM